MKQVGLNVASDPLLSAAYTGVAGGFLVIAADDPGPHSSQTEQDTRLFALFAKVPVFDPATPREAKEMVEAAFTLSEQFEMPVLLRPTTRVCHATQNIDLLPVPEANGKAKFKKDPARWAATPRFRYLLHKELNQKLRDVEAVFEQSSFNPVSGPEGEAPLGIITGGACSTVVREVLADVGASDRVPVLRIGTPYPLPQKLVADFVARCERVVVLEEPDVAIELQISDKSKVSGRLDDTVPSAGELTPEVVYGVLADALAGAGIATPEPVNGELQAILADFSLPIRKPRLCPGCPHRSSFFNIKRTFPKAILPSDIGCYTLGLNLRAVDTVIDMGAAITMASGFYHAYKLDGEDKPVVATIGDSTFLHSGLPGLTNAVHTNARFVLVILDNGITAMTGMQPTAQSEQLAYGTTDKILSIERLAKACGVGFVKEVDPYDYGAMERVLNEAGEHTRAEDGGVAVVISKRACVLYDTSEVRENPVPVEVTEECDGCNYCLVAFECPALVLSPDGERVDIDRRICIDCGECIEGCYKGFIVPQSQIDLVDLASA
jgi:indolepyruvate ferredoxin oxidoreductase alpha subunit